MNTIHTSCYVSIHSLCTSHYDLFPLHYWRTSRCVNAFVNTCKLIRFRAFVSACKRVCLRKPRTTFARSCSFCTFARSHSRSRSRLEGVSMQLAAQPRVLGQSSDIWCLQVQFVSSLAAMDSGFDNFLSTSGVSGRTKTVLIEQGIVNKSVFSSLREEHFEKLLPKLTLGQHALLMKLCCKWLRLERWPA